MVKRGIKKGDDLKSEDKDSNTGDTIGAHVGYTTTNEESTVPSGEASIRTHVLEKNKQLSRPSRTVEKILEAHPMNDGDFWGSTNPDDMSINTTNSKEMMTGSYITELHIHTNT